METYFLKVNVAIALFYAFYRLFFYRDTFFTWRRTALLGFFATAVAIPLLNIQMWVTEQEPMKAMADLYATVILPEVTPQAVASTDWKGLITTCIQWLYGGGAVMLAIRFLIRLTGIIRLAVCCPKRRILGTEVHLLPHETGPFSFFQWIFVHPASHTEAELDEILTHERTHARQWHSADVIVSELACILCWPNPFVWLMKREIRNNLEYLADERVLADGYDSRTYQYHLLGLTHHKAAATLTNNFNVLPLKKRITMMNKKRTHEIGRTKYLLFLPLAALLMIISNIESVARTTSQLAKEMIETPVLQTPQKGVVFEVVEQMPEFPGGMAALMKYLGENIKYPKEAQEKKIEGRVVVSLIIEKDGTADSVTVLRGVDPLLDAEAIRVMKAMPKWKPGKQRGQEVRVKYTVPVMFRLNATANNNGTNNIIARDIPVKNPNGTYNVVDQMPEYPGGMGALMQYLAANIKYPKEAQEKKEQGRVVVQFLVDTDGSTSDFQILRGVSPSLDAEALRILKGMPKWKPGMQDGKAVAVKYTVPVMFSL